MEQGVFGVPKAVIDLVTPVAQCVKGSSEGYSMVVFAFGSISLPGNPLTGIAVAVVLVETPITCYAEKVGYRK